MAFILILHADSELTIGDDWLVETDCSSSDSIMVSYVDSRTHTIVDLGWEPAIDVQVMEVRLECYPADRGAAGGIDQVSTIGRCMHACMVLIATIT